MPPSRGDYVGFEGLRGSSIADKLARNSAELFLSDTRRYYHDVQLQHLHGPRQYRAGRNGRPDDDPEPLHRHTPRSGHVADEHTADRARLLETRPLSVSRAHALRHRLLHAWC